MADIDAELGPLNPSQDSGQPRRVLAPKFRNNPDQPSTRNAVNSKTFLNLCCMQPDQGLASTLAITIFSSILPIASLYIGIRFWDQQYCPVEQVALLIVSGGSLSLASTLFGTCVQLCVKRSEDTQTHPAIVSGILVLFRLASIAWLITSWVMVFGVYSDVTYDSTDEFSYCHPTLYRFAFWLLIIGPILLGAACLCGICSLLCLACIAGIAGKSKE